MSGSPGHALELRREQRTIGETILVQGLDQELASLFLLLSIAILNPGLKQFVQLRSTILRRQADLFLPVACQLEGDRVGLISREKLIRFQQLGDHDSELLSESLDRRRFRSESGDVAARRDPDPGFGVPVSMDAVDNISHQDSRVPQAKWSRTPVDSEALRRHPTGYPGTMGRLMGVAIDQRRSLLMADGAGNVIPAWWAPRMPTTEVSNSNRQFPEESGKIQNNTEAVDTHRLRPVRTYAVEGPLPSRRRYPQDVSRDRSFLPVARKLPGQNAANNRQS